MANTRLTGIVAMLGAVGLFGVMDALLKLLVEHYPPFQVTALRGIASLPFVLLIIGLRGRFQNIRPRHWRWHLLRGVIAIAMLASFVFAIRTLSLADTYAIYMCAPLMITALAVPLLGERVDTRQWIAIVIGFGGVLIMLRPGSGDWSMIGGILATASAVFYALSAVTLRMLSRSETTESLVFSFALLMSVGAGLLALPTWQAIQAAHLPWLLGIGVSGAVAQVLITEAFRRAPASVIAPFEYTALVWGMLFDLVIWRVLPSAVTLLGGGVVIAAGLYLIRREASQIQPDLRKR